MSFLTILFVEKIRFLLTFFSTSTILIKGIQGQNQEHSVLRILRICLLQISILKRTKLHPLELNMTYYMNKK